VAGASAAGPAASARPQVKQKAALGGLRVPQVRHSRPLAYSGRRSVAPVAAWAAGAPHSMQYLLSAGISAPQFAQRILAILLALLKLIDILLLDP
jgi:hypothetical protein